MALPSIVTHIEQVPLGPIVRKFVIGYNHKPERHVELIVDIFWNCPHGLYFDTYDEAAAYCREKRLLRQYCSSIWNRERACAYAEYLDMTVNELRGKAEQPRISTTLGPDIHRSEWLRCEELRTEVTCLQRELDWAAYWFNHNLVATWFTWIDPSCMDWPEILKEFEQSDVRQQAPLFDRLCFGQGSIFLRSCSRYYDAIASLEHVQRETRNLFLLTPEQLQELTRLRVGAGPKGANTAVAEEVALEEPEEPAQPQERRTPGGIYLP